MPLPRLFSIAVAWGLAARAAACPFCATEQRTLTEEMADASVVLVARLSAASEAAQKLAAAGVPYAFVDPETGAAKFTVERVLKGAPLVEGVEEIEAIYFGESDTEQRFFIRGVGTPPDWAVPLALTDIAADYVPKLLELPASGADRLAFFQEYLEHDDPLLAQDAYDEFARAPYPDVEALAPRMDREQLRAWIDDPGVSPSRRRLFLTMLGVCGEAADVRRLERMLTSDGRVTGPAMEAAAVVAVAAGGAPAFGVGGELARFADRQRKLGLDAHVACYLTLAGRHTDAEQALALIDQRYLRDPDADYSHVYAVLQALRFLGEEQRDLAPIERVLASARLLLDNPEFADQVIPDLARWQDWSVLDRLTGMYRATFAEDGESAPNRYVREPIVTYLDVAREQPGEVGERAARALAAIEALDPQAVARARSLQQFGFLAQARSRGDSSPKAAAAADSAADSAADPAGDIAIDPPADVVADLAADFEEEATPPGSTPDASGADRQEGSDIAQAAGPVEGAAPSPAPALAPPSRLVLIGVPVGGAALLVALFWLILRSGLS